MKKKNKKNSSTNFFFPLKTCQIRRPYASMLLSDANKLWQKIMDFKCGVVDSINTVWKAWIVGHWENVPAIPHLGPKRRRRHHKQKWSKRSSLRIQPHANPHRPAFPSLFLANAQSFAKKTDKFRLRIISCRMDSCVAIVAETWRDNNIPVEERGTLCLSRWDCSFS